MFVERYSLNKHVSIFKMKLVTICWFQNLDYVGNYKLNGNTHCCISLIMRNKWLVKWVSLTPIALLLLGIWRKKVWEWKVFKISWIIFFTEKYVSVFLRKEGGCHLENSIHFFKIWNTYFENPQKFIVKLMVLQDSKTIAIYLVRIPKECLYSLALQNGLNYSNQIKANYF